MKILSILIPVYNERNTILKILEKLENVNFDSVGFEKEIIIIDDKSTDGTREVLKDLKDKYKIIFNKKNLGKGRSLRRGIKIVTGDWIVAQDADLEYEPQDILKLLKFALEKDAQVVYGSRRLQKNRYSYYLYLIGANFITWVGNVLYKQKLTDQETCYKLIKTSIIKTLDLQAKSFDIENEITAKLSKLGYKIPELPINYNPRKIEEGKKIKFRHGLLALYTLFKYLFWKPIIQKQ